MGVYAAGAGGGSFSVGLSTQAAAAKSAVGADCATDFIEIPQGRAIAMAVAVDDMDIGSDRYCGRLLNIARDLVVGTPVCSVVRPFRLGVNFDATEAIGAAGANVNELSAPANEPLGTWGFELAFTQMACN